MYRSVIDETPNIDDNDKNFQCSRPSIIIKRKRKIYEKTFASKWANFKLFLKERKSLESSVKLQKKNTIDQFSSKCKEIYKNKVKIHLITKKNRQMFQSFNNKTDYKMDKDTQDISQKISKMKILDASIEFESNANDIKEFLFAFRTNNDIMLRLIEFANNDQCEILVPFLCHFFYENFYRESTEQEEILYIIYLLLEKEIDSLYTPSVSTFLEQSFISNFLTEMGNRYEIKHYIDIILNELIINIEETNITYNSMDILGNQSKNNEGVYYDMNEENYSNNLNKTSSIDKNEIMSKRRNDTIGDTSDFKLDENISFTQPEKNLKMSMFLLNESKFSFKGNAVSINDIKNNSNYVSKTQLKKDINENLFNNIDEKFIRDKLKNEKDDIMKHFYVRHLRKLQAAKNSNLYNGTKYYEKLKNKGKIYKSSVIEFNSSYHLIYNFINKLLENLENNTIIPYTIKVICKFIYVLLQKRFKNITKIQCNILICQFLFDKLIFPVLQNPDINDVGKEMIISFNTRKTLSNIYDVCKKLVRGELFSITDRDYFVIFNNFIINNYSRINNIIDNIIHVNAPEKLISLSEQFYGTENFDLNKLQREDYEINYDYFLENPNDFMQHRSICFSLKEFAVFYDIVNENKDYFLEITKYLEPLIPIRKLKGKKDYENNYYMIISDEYDDEIKELLNHEENKITLEKVKSLENIAINIKNCIEFVINNVEIFPNWKWVNENWDTLRTFQFIHTYLTTYNLDSRNYLKNQEGKIPLSWYSLYIINNLKKIKATNFYKNDYQNLYENMEAEVMTQLKKLRKLNNFLTINMSTKFILIDHKIKIFNQELENVQKTELSIKTVQFIENTKIKVCLTTINDLYDISKYISNFNEYFDKDSKNKFILVIRNNNNECIHKTKLDSKFYKKEKINLSKMHCKNINEFCTHLAEYYKIISHDILNGINQTPNESNTHKMKYIQRSAKDVVETYMKHLTSVIKESNIFDKAEDRQNALHIIWNYILKNLCIKICENEKNEKDKIFRTTCKKLGWIKPENLKIPKGVFNSKIFEKVQYHIKKMDNLSTPGGILDQFGLGVQLIHSMFIFMMNQQNTDVDELLPLIIYGIINTKPKRMIFNINFIKYFMNENQNLGNEAYNLVQVAGSTKYIQDLNGEKLNMNQQEFDKRCDEYINRKSISRSINDDSDWD